MPRSGLASPSWQRAAALALLMYGCSLRDLGELEGDGSETSVASARVQDGGACVHDSQCGEGRCREEVGRCELCPDDMRLVHIESGAAICIEATEVSRAGYSAFLQALDVEPAPVLDSALCGGKSSFRPGDGPDCSADYRANDEPSLPITCVDLCDAMAYCSWRGRRLCGGPDGAMLRVRQVDTSADEWLAACTGGGTRAFAYGEAFEPVCNIRSESLVPVDARPECSTETGVTQLNGNAAEWVLSCRSPNGMQECLLRGGEFRTQDISVASCWVPPAGVAIAVPPMALPPLSRSVGVGIRCCSD